MSDELPHDEELRSLYRKLPADEPRVEVDEAILAAAREIAEQSARHADDRAGADEHERHRSRFAARMRWMLPLAAAASVILTVSLARLAPERSAVPATVSLDERREEVDSVRPAPPAAPVAEKQNQPGPAGEDARDGSEPAASAEADREPAKLRAEERKKAEAETLADEKKKDEKRVARDERKEDEKRVAPDEKKEDEKRVAPAQKKATVTATEEARDTADAAAGSASDAAREVPRRSEDRLRSLGYLSGKVAPEQPEHAPAAPPAAAEPAAEPPDHFAAPAAPPAAPPAAASSAETPGHFAASPDTNASQRKAPEPMKDDAQQRGRPANQELAKSAAGASPAARADTTASAEDWPFGLTPRLAQAEACRLVSSALRRSCRFEGSTAVVEMEDGAVIDRGEFAGRRLTRLELVAENGLLAKIVLRIEGFATDQVLLAPAR